MRTSCAISFHDIARFFPLIIVMHENLNKMNNTNAKLSSKDIWELIKYGFTAVVVCAFVFVLPYLLLFGAELTLKGFSGSEAASSWTGYLFGAIILYLVISNLTAFLNSISRLCTDLAKMTDGMPFLKKVLLVIIFIVYVRGWHHFPKITFFVSVLLIIPYGFTYDRYKMLLKKKSSTECEE